MNIEFRYTALGTPAHAPLLPRHGLRLVRHHFDAWDTYVNIAAQTPPSEP